MVESIGTNSSNDSYRSPDFAVSGNPRNMEKSGINGATFNFINSIIGAGLIGLPHAVEECGVLLGFFSLVMVSFFTYISSISMILCGVATSSHGYEDLGETCFGRPGRLFVLFGMIAQGFGAMCVYLIIIGDTLTPVFNSMLDQNYSRQTYIFLSSLLFILPLALVKNMAKLNKSSFISISAAALIVAIFAFKSPADADSQGIEFEYTFAKVTVFSGIGTMSFAFVCQHSTFIVFNTLREPTFRNWTKVGKLSVGVSFLISFLFAAFGVFTFGPSIKPDPLLNLEPGGMANLSKVLLAATMILTYPMENFVVRHCLQELVFGRKPNMNDATENKFEKLGDPAHEDSTGQRSYISNNDEEYQQNILSVGIFLVTLFIGLAVEDLGFMFDLVGAFAGSTLAYILPAGCYLYLSKKRVIEENSQLKTANTLVLVFGIVALALGTGQTLHDKFS
eukprot:snap_masked-scaffold_3-processed-gene-5.11-mRNA-1 protein AED:0.32 eAED:0.32 QI:76/1/1/1/0.33/0.25/4/18/449